MVTQSATARIEKEIKYNTATDRYDCWLIVDGRRDSIGSAASYGAAEQLCAEHADAQSRVDALRGTQAGAETLAALDAAQLGALRTIVAQGQFDRLLALARWWAAGADGAPLPVTAQRPASPNTHDAASQQIALGTEYRCGQAEIYVSDNVGKPPVLFAFGCDAIDLSDLERDLRAVLTLMIDPQVQAACARHRG